MLPTLTRNNSTYFPDDLPHPSRLAASAPPIEVTYSQCGCTITDPSSAFQFYGDVQTWSPASPTSSEHRVGEGSESGTPPRARSPSPGMANDVVVRRTESGFCERAICERSSVFNREWARIWASRNSEMKEALDNKSEYEKFKASVREEARVATEGMLGPIGK